MDPDKIRGDANKPYNKPQQEDESSDKIDPEKFKKVMKVDESEESQKRKKRNLSREEEEGDDEPAAADPSTPSGSFSEFMSDKDDLDSVFDKESGGVRRQSAPETDAFIAPPDEQISTEGIEVNENEQTPPPSPSQSSPPQEQSSSSAPQTSSEQAPSPPPSQTPPTSEDQTSGNLPQFQGEFQPQESSQPQQQQPQPQQPSSTDQTESTQQAQKPTKKEQSGQEEMPKKKEEDTSLLSSQPKKSALDALKKKPKAGPAPEIKTTAKGEKPAEKKISIPQEVVDKPSAFLHTQNPPPKKETDPGTSLKEGSNGDQKDPDAKILPINKASPEEKSKEKVPEETKKQESAPKPGKGNQPGSFQRFTPQEVRSQKMGKEASPIASYEGLVVPTSSESEQGEMGGQGKKKGDDSFIEASSETAGIPLPTFEAPVPAVSPVSETPAYSKLSSEMHELFAKIGGVILIQQDKGVTTTTVNVNMPNSVFDGTQVVLDQYSTAPNSYNIQFVGNPESVKVFSQNLAALKESFKAANYNFEVNIQNPILTREKKSPHLIRRKGSAGGKKGKK